MNIKRRNLLIATVGALTATPVLRPVHGAGDRLLHVYKTRTCGCCGDWVSHMKANGFDVKVTEVSDVTPHRHRLGVPDALASCHTAEVGGYAIEGHVPAADVQRLLRQKPKARGLAVPGMVPGSPGMGGAPVAYQTLMFDSTDRYTVFERH